MCLEQRERKRDLSLNLNIIPGREWLGIARWVSTTLVLLLSSGF